MLSLAATGCEAGPAERAAVATPEPDRPTVVDSILPIEEEMRRFRAIMGPDPGRLTGGASSLDALVDGFASALARSDTAALIGMHVSRDEFGWLYYPHTRFTAPPYELPPALLWFQIENASTTGLGRLLGRLGGRIEVLSHTCAPEPAVEGPNRIWEGCVVRYDTADEEPRELTLFGSILEREGVFKFLSYSNGF